MWGWIFGLVGAIGVAGFVALLILAPVVAQGVIAAVSDILRRLLGSRAGCVFLAVVGVALIAFPFGDHVGESRIRTQWAAANAVAADKARDADNLAAAHAEFTDKRDTAAEVDADAANTEARNAYIADLEKRAAAVCTLGDTDLKRLHDIR